MRGPSARSALQALAQHGDAEWGAVLDRRERDGMLGVRAATEALQDALDSGRIEGVVDRLGRSIDTRGLDDADRRAAKVVLLMARGQARREAPLAFDGQTVAELLRDG